MKRMLPSTVLTTGGLSLFCDAVAALTHQKMMMMGDRTLSVKLQRKKTPNKWQQKKKEERQ